MKKWIVIVVFMTVFFGIVGCVRFLSRQEWGGDSEQKSNTTAGRRATESSVPLPVGRYELIFESDFEHYTETTKGKFRYFYLSGEDNPDWMSVGNPTAHIAKDPLDPGNRAMAIPLNYTDPIKYRTEIKLEKIKQFELGKVYKIDFRFLLPSDWQRDELADLIMQIHGQKDSAEFSRNPPISILIEKDDLKLVIRGDRNETTQTNLITRKHRYTEPTRDYQLGTVQKNSWTMITIEFLNRFDSKGWLNLWVDGKLVVGDNGANAYNDRLGGYLNVGNYKYPWRSNKPRGSNSRLHYIDDVNVYVHSFRR